MSLLQRAVTPRYGVRGRVGNNKERPFQRILSHTDWWQADLETAAGLIQAPAGKWTRIGQFTIPPQQQIYFGYGSAQDWMNQGFIHLALFDDTPIDSKVIEGVIRLRQMDANETMIYTVYEGRTEVLRGDPADKMRMTPLPLQDHVPKAITVEDCRLVIDLMSDNPVNVVKTAIGAAAGKDIWNIPVSVYHVR